MKKLFFIFLVLPVFIQNAFAIDEKEKELFDRVINFTGNYEEDLHRFKQKALVDLTEEEKDSVIGFSIERKINPKYIEEYEKNSKQKYTPTAKINPWLATHYDPEYFMEYLEKIPARTLAQKYQLLVLWQIYKPEKINSEEYKEIAEAVHLKTMEYLSDDDNWQASWRRDEYKETVQDDFQKCYTDTNCLLKAIPYWMDLRIPMKVILPCDFAKAHDLLYYVDYAAGGSGTQTIMISTYAVDKKYNFTPELDTYIDNTIFEKIPYTTGSIIHAYYAAADARYWDIKYRPDFNTAKIPDWRDFPYTEWAVQSYYNFKKFNEVINRGIGYKKAVDMLTDYYVKVFNAKPRLALNAALIALNPPSSSDFKRITPDNLNYLLLTDAPWKKIEKQLSKDVNPAKLLELSIAYPQNLQQLIKLTNNVDVPNAFGKTPLQTAAQYGYLESVKILLDAGADINHQTDDSNCYSDFEIECIHNGKRTALMYALQENHFKVAQYLLDENADITLMDSQGKTAFDYLTKSAPTFSTHKTGTIYGGEAKQRIPDDDEKMPQEEYNKLYRQLFFNQQPQIAELLIGKWESSEEDETAVFEKNIDPDEPLLIIKNNNGIFAECDELEDSRNVFNCIFQPDSGKKNNFEVYFDFAHYYKDKIKMYYSLEKGELDICLQDSSCEPKILTVMERHSEQDEE